MATQPISGPPEAPPTAHHTAVGANEVLTVLPIMTGVASQCTLVYVCRSTKTLRKVGMQIFKYKYANV